VTDTEATDINSHSVLAGPPLYPWDVGPDVEKLQQLLRAHGFDLKVDGDFGSLTEAAVRAYQRRHQFRADGVVRPEIWVALRTTVQPGARPLSEGDIGMDVFELQKLLQVNGWQVQPDAVFATQTRDAVIAFQQKHKLLADGRVGSVTWTMLREGRPLPPVPRQTGWFFNGRKWL